MVKMSANATDPLIVPPMATIDRSWLLIFHFFIIALNSRLSPKILTDLAITQTNI